VNIGRAGHVIPVGNANVYSLTLRQSAIPEKALARSGGAHTQVMSDCGDRNRARAYYARKAAARRAGI